MGPLRVAFVFFSLCLGTLSLRVSADGTTLRILIAGDSTAATSGAEDVQGWGATVQEYFDSGRVEVRNRARGGRSSRTFMTEGLWDRLLAEVRAGDLVLIQFGHNDGGAINAEPPGSTRPLRARGSLPGLGEETEAIDNVLTGKHELVHSYGWYLRKMVADVRARGAVPILLSPTICNRWDEAGQVECGGRYRDWTKEVAAAAENEGGELVSFIDLSQILANDYQARGREVVAAFFSRDNLHTNALGAANTAALLAAALKELEPRTRWQQGLKKEDEPKARSARK